MLVGNVEQHVQKLSRNNSEQTLRGVLHVPQNTKLTIAKQPNAALLLSTGSKRLDAADRQCQQQQLRSAHFHCYCYCYCLCMHYYYFGFLLLLLTLLRSLSSAVNAYAVDKIVNLTSLSS